MELVSGETQAEKSSVARFLWMRRDIATQHGLILAEQQPTCRRSRPKEKWSTVVGLYGPLWKYQKRVSFGAKVATLNVCGGCSHNRPMLYLRFFRGRLQGFAFFSR